MGSRTCDIAGGCTMLSSRVSSALFVFFCFAIMTDEVLTTPDEVSELGEWLGAGRGGNLAANANGMLAAIQRKIQRKGRNKERSSSSKESTDRERKHSSSRDSTSRLAAKAAKAQHTHPVASIGRHITDLRGIHGRIRQVENQGSAV